MSLFVVNCVERKERYDFLGHLEDIGDDMRCVLFLCFFLGLLYKCF